MKKYAFLLAMAAVVAGLTMACTSENDLVEAPEQPAQPATGGVTVTVSAGIVDDATTRSEVATSTDSETGKPIRTLKFTEGDRLYVYGDYPGGEYFYVKGMLTMVENSLSADGKSAKFAGSLQAFNSYSWNEVSYFGNNDPLVGTTATLIHKDMVEGTDYGINSKNGNLTRTTVSAPDVETLMTRCLNVMGSYDSSTKSFALSGADVIFNCTFTGLEASTNYYCRLRYPESQGYSVYGGHYFTTDDNGTCSYAFRVSDLDGEHPWEIEIQKGNTTFGTISLGGTRTLAKKIYNVRRRFIDLSKLEANFEAQNGDVLTGTLVNNVKITIAYGATVTLSGVSINADGEWKVDYHAGITCLGDATIMLSGVNTVKGFNKSYPGIQPAKREGDGEEYTLTISGTGKLDASSNGSGAGIGSGYYTNPTAINCGNITISGSVTVIATGGEGAAGIGSGYLSKCGNITISGSPIVSATGGLGGAGIGSGNNQSECGNITISGGSVTAKSPGNPSRVGSGIGCGLNFAKCGTITITDGANKIEATTANKAYIGGNTENATFGTVTIDGVENAWIDSEFEHFNSVVDGYTWTLTHK